MLLFYQISAWVFLIHMFLYAGFYCSVRLLNKITEKILLKAGLLGAAFVFKSISESISSSFFAPSTFLSQLTECLTGSWGGVYTLFSILP